MKRPLPILLGIALFFSLTSEKCKEASGDPSATGTGSANPSMSTILGTKWNLSTLSGQAIRLPEGVQNPNFTIAEDQSLSGFGGCNRLMGKVKVEGSSVSFPGLGSTKMYCKDSQDVETSFLTALHATNTYRLEGDKLILLDKSKELATLVKGQ